MLTTLVANFVFVRFPKIFNDVQPEIYYSTELKTTYYVDKRK